MRKKRKSQKRSPRITELYKDSFELIKSAKTEILIIVLVLFLMALVGYYMPFLFEEQVLEILKKMILELEGKEGLSLIIHIFANNSQASLFGILIGVVFGIFPLLAVFVNGYVIGFTSQLAVSKAGALILLKLIPHGIFELPAVILSMAIGLYLGGRLLEIKFKIKDKTKRTSVLFLIFLISIPLVSIFLLSAGQIQGLEGIEYSSYSPIQFIFLFYSFFFTLFCILGLILVIITFIKNKELRVDLARAILTYIIVIIPLLIIAGIIEGLLITLT